MLVPLIAAWPPTWLAFEISDNDQELQLAVFVAVVLALHVANWSFWLGPEARTLGDRLGAARVVRRSRRSEPPLWPDVLLIAPPLLVTAGYGSLPGVLPGAVAAALVMLLPGVIRRTKK